MAYHLNGTNQVKWGRPAQFMWILLLLFTPLFYLSGEEIPHIMTRTSDPIVIPAHTFKAEAMPIKNINLYIIKDGKKEAIPFQIDEVDKKGNYIFPFGKKANPEDSDGVFSRDDELVFMIKDTGNRAESGIFSKCDMVKEIEIIDPIDQSNRWVYLVKTAHQATDLSTVDYVNYDMKTTTVDAMNYIMQFDKDFAAGFAKLSTKPVFGGTGDNWVDRVKVRLDYKLRIGLRIKKDEDAFFSADLAHIDGPVRVIRRTANRVQLWWKIKSPSAIVDNIFYYDYYYYPMKIDVPFNPGLFFSEGNTRISQDWMSLNKDKNIVYYNSNNLNGVKIDGTMTEDERALNKDLFAWSATLCNNGQGPGTFSFLVRGAELKNLDYGLYYMDDMAVEDAPEKEPGHFGDTGFIFEKGYDLERGTYTFEMHQFILPKGCKKGFEKNYMNILENKLTYKVSDYRTLQVSAN